MAGNIIIKKRKQKVKPDFDIGELVVYGNSGVCKVSDIVCMPTPGSNEEKDYYKLEPVGNNKSQIYAVVGQDKVMMRSIITKELAQELMDSVEEIEELEVENEKFREDTYKKIIQSGDCREWFRMVKTLTRRNHERVEQGRKVTSTDERYLREAQHSLFTELSIVLDRDISEISEIIIDSCTEEF
ncbi:MAG: CarD family transcriptional regulator [Lachnospiraceae bacterium]|nr:CarD family transcriptional regulator [Lachnospiraceae bacterium]